MQHVIPDIVVHEADHSEEINLDFFTPKGRRRNCEVLSSSNEAVSAPQLSQLDEVVKLSSKARLRLRMKTLAQKFTNSLADELTSILIDHCDQHSLSYSDDEALAAAMCDNASNIADVKKTDEEYCAMDKFPGRSILNKAASDSAINRTSRIPVRLNRRFVLSYKYMMQQKGRFLIVD